MYKVLLSTIGVSSALRRQTPDSLALQDDLCSTVEECHVYILELKAQMDKCDCHLPEPPVVEERVNSTVQDSADWGGEGEAPVPEPEPKEPPAPPPPPPEPIKQGDVGGLDEAQAQPIYDPPIAFTGVPDADQGYDYRQDGTDWSWACGTGSGQSPVSFEHLILDVTNSTKSNLWFDYFQDPSIKASTALPLENAGHGLFEDLSKVPVDFGTVKLGTDEFVVKEVNFHTPAEHHIDDKRYPLEVQITHTLKGSGQLLAVSILFEEDDAASNPFLAAYVDGLGTFPKWTLEGHAASASLTGDHGDGFNLEKILPQESVISNHPLDFFVYDGTRTQPPCDGDVKWWVLRTPLKASSAEIGAFETAIFEGGSTPRGNARAIQERDDRFYFNGQMSFSHDRDAQRGYVVAETR